MKPVPQEHLVEAAFCKAQSSHAALKTYMGRLSMIHQRVQAGVEECRAVRDTVAHHLGVDQAYTTAALATLPLQSLVELAEETAELCSQELVFKAALIEAAAAPEPYGVGRVQAQANLSCWVARPFLGAARLGTIRRTLAAEQSR